MTETEYIDSTNLAKLRVLRTVLDVVHIDGQGVTEGEMGAISKTLYSMTMRLEKKVKVTE